MNNMTINGACFYCPNMGLRRRIVEMIGRACKASFLRYSFYASLENDANKWIVFKVYHTPVITVTMNNKISRCYVCDDFYDFIIKCRSLCHMAEQVPQIVEDCKIGELPKYIRNIARCRYINELEYIGVDSTIAAKGVDDKTVSCFSWADTNEGYHFWSVIYSGYLPSDTNTALLLFDMEDYVHRYN